VYLIITAASANSILLTGNQSATGRKFLIQIIQQLGININNSRTNTQGRYC
jgi:anthranilate phosphoribosyltransferase